MLQSPRGTGQYSVTSQTSQHILCLEIIIFHYISSFINNDIVTFHFHFTYLH